MFFLPSSSSFLCFPVLFSSSCFSSFILFCFFFCYERMAFSSCTYSIHYIAKPCFASSTVQLQILLHDSSSSSPMLTMCSLKNHSGSSALGYPVVNVFWSSGNMMPKKNRLCLWTMAETGVITIALITILLVWSEYGTWRILLRHKVSEGSSFIA